MNRLRIRSKSMLGTSHSWAVTMRSLLRQFDKFGHELCLNSMNGYDLFPEEWLTMRNEGLGSDIDLAYTLPRNFRHRFSKGSKLKLAIYNYETSIMPDVWKNDISFVDYALPSSNFSKKVFVDAGWPEDRCIVVPHGINLEDFEDKSKVNNLKTRKKFKFLNVSIPHYRKNIGHLIDAYYSAFTDRDDTCLVLKVKLDKPKYRFECDVKQQLIGAQKKHQGRSLPQIEIVQHKYASMVPLYNSCDCLVSATSAEGFGLPMLEALAAGMLVVAPRATGQLDFLNDNNAVLVDVKEVDATDRYQYWRPTAGAKTFMPELDMLAESMRNAYDNYSSLSSRLAPAARETVERFTWEAAAKQILALS